MKLEGLIQGLNIMLPGGQQGFLQFTFVNVGVCGSENETHPTP